MERVVPLTMRRVLVLLVVLALFRGTAGAQNEHELVLAASSNSPIAELSASEARKLYLGVPVEKAGTTIVPLLNLSDRILFEVFLQKVTFMSADIYERQVMAIVFRLGGQRPAPFRDTQSLAQALRANPNAVSFLWGPTLRELGGLKVVSTLWAGPAD